MNIADFVQQRVGGYPSMEIELAEGFIFNEFQTKRRIHFYDNSQYETGSQDELGREKPFYNISKWRKQVAVRSTDLDTKNFQVIANHEDAAVQSMLLGRALYNWMQVNTFALTLNEAGQARAKWGGQLIKKYKEKGRVKIGVCDWRNVVSDPVDVESCIIEGHDMSPAQLNAKAQSWEHVDEAIALATKVRETPLKTKSDTFTDTTRVYEVAGEFPKSYFEDEAEGYAVYHAFLAGVDEGKPLVLWKEVISSVRDVYRYLAWEKQEGRGLGVGVIEDGFEAQTWTNDVVQKERNMLDHASRIMFVTDDSSIENNALKDYDNGHIIKTEDGKKFAQLNMVPTAFPQLDAVMAKWDQQYQRVSNTFEAVTGETLPARTPFRAIATMNAEGSSGFRYRLEEAGIFWAEVITDWVLPDLIAHMAESLTAEFSADELRAVDEAIATKAVNQALVEHALSPVDEFQPLDPMEPAAMKDDALRQLGGKPPKRTVKLPKGYFKNYKYSVTIDTTGEAIDKATTFESLNNILITVAQNPAVLTDPNLSKLFNKVIELSGIGVSAAQFQGAAAAQMTGPTAPGAFAPATMGGNANAAAPAA